MNQIFLPGINIQYPWSALLLDGRKTIETRSYPIPQHYMGRWIAVIQTPGHNRSLGKACITGVIQFEKSFRYLNHDHWQSDFHRHLVEPTDENFAFVKGKQKYGWVVADVIAFSTAIPAPKKRGIVFASECAIPHDFVMHKLHARH